MIRLSVFFLCALTLLVVALSTGGAIYYLLFAMMAMMAVLSAFSCAWMLFSLRIRCTYPPSRVVRGESASLSVESQHFCPIPVGNIQVSFFGPQTAGIAESIDLSSVPFRRRLSHHHMRFPHRGQHIVGINALEVSDIFGLFHFRKKIKDQSVVISVMPRVVELPPLDLSSGDSGPETFAQNTDDTASPSDIRNYQQGDALKRIHWKLTMRKRELIVRTYEESPRPDTLVLMDCSAINATLNQALHIEDALCETAASLIKAQLQADFPVRIPLMSLNPVEISGQSSASFPMFLDALSEVQFDGIHTFEKVLALEMRRIQRTGGVILISSRLSMQIADAAVQMRRTGMQVCLCWITDAQRAETLEVLTRMELQGVQVKRINPWQDANLGMFKA